MIGKEFFCDGGDDDDGDGDALLPGRWKVREIVGNEYRCDRMSGDGKQVENFDIGYVHRAHQEAWQHLREQGPKWFARYHTGDHMW